MDEEKPADEKNLGENNVLIDRFFRGTQYRVTTDRTPLPTLPTPYYTNVHRWIFQPSHRRGRYVRVEDSPRHNQSCHFPVTGLDHAVCRQIIGQQRLGTPIPPAPLPVETRTMNLVLRTEPKKAHCLLPTGRNKKRSA